MRVPRHFLPFRIFLTTILIGTAGCGALDLAGLGLFGSDTGGLSAQTVLTSSSLSASGTEARTRTVIDGPGGLRISPANVDGKVLSVLFVIDDREDEGIVVFGNERPDIAPSHAELHNFDLARQLTIDSNISLPPTFRGGQSSTMVMLFGYMDFSFALGGSAHTVRVALADIAPMQRGDVLLLSSDPPPTQPSTDASDLAAVTALADGFEWLDLDTNEFTNERPTRPALIEQVRNFTDPIRRDLVFYPINVDLTESVQLAANDILNADAVAVVIDFELGQSITLVDQHFERLDARELIAAFSLSQINAGFGDSGFRANASLEYTGLPAQAEPAPEPQVAIFDLRGGIPDIAGDEGSLIGAVRPPNP